MLRFYEGEVLFSLSEFAVSVAKEDQTEDRDRILGGFQFGVGAQLIGGIPEAFLDFVVVFGHRCFCNVTFVNNTAPEGMK
jgi:hypothetical protein